MKEFWYFQRQWTKKPSFVKGQRTTLLLLPSPLLMLSLFSTSNTRQFYQCPSYFFPPIDQWQWNPLPLIANAHAQEWNNSHAYPIWDLNRQGTITVLEQMRLKEEKVFLQLCLIRPRASTTSAWLWPTDSPFCQPKTGNCNFCTGLVGPK